MSNSDLSCINDSEEENLYGDEDEVADGDEVADFCKALSRICTFPICKALSRICTLLICKSTLKNDSVSGAQ